MNVQPFKAVHNVIQKAWFTLRRRIEGFFIKKKRIKKKRKFERPVQ